MKIAIPLFYNRVSPRFDFAPTLLVATIEKNQIVEKREIRLKNYTFSQRSALLRDLGITTLICGGVQGFLTRSLGNQNVQVIAPVAGEVSEVLQRFLEGTLCAAFRLKGCQRRNRAMFGGKKEKREKNFGERGK